ncbi:hypothetical protein RSal33209_3088 [Renibacterium salmoninarum ATCC 33209]|uniref:DUF6286 domain-containing protein n=1 Tax=Renibacterium salmoninarum (strain ATCC 33209 / DSM 20767 / JCM 11484 / NBRC 15589 / NCIMB 2235) TaxID=288705 RepID=A9WUD8_RENSM|nr:DUF6286 domain-containing protein [Renibacterium salmoninarum]ABY24809.1 hypothetical protein RSal33209_3088 [Renibacterium salmoninarum ATCC 33209]
MSSTDVLAQFRPEEEPAAPKNQSGSTPAPAGGKSLDLTRAVRRELSSSRAIISGVAAFIITVLSIYALLECGLRIVNQPAWLIDPQTALDRLAQLPQGMTPVLLGVIGAVLLLFGLIFFLKAVRPGRRARHTLVDPRIAVVVDDEVIASALARRARLASGVTQEQVMVVVSQHNVVVNVRPTSGVALNSESIKAAIENELESMQPKPLPQVRVNVAATGVIGV